MGKSKKRHSLNKLLEDETIIESLNENDCKLYYKKYFYNMENTSTQNYKAALHEKIDIAKNKLRLIKKFNFEDEDDFYNKNQAMKNSKRIY